MSALHIPRLKPGAGTLAAALAYAAAGWYVVPIRQGTKHPGSVVGDSWQRQSSRDPEQIVAWFAGTDHGIAIHVGRSGAVAFDVDAPDKLQESPALADAIHSSTAPYQSTRADVPGRGHHVFAQPDGRIVGNGTSRLGGTWGQVRGRNGIIVVQPTSHEDATEGGRYEWRQTGPVPVLPDAVAELLDDSADAEDAATDAAVEAFFDAYTAATRPDLLNALCSTFENKVAAGESRHQRMVSVATGAMKEARAGYYAARVAADTLESMFLVAVAKPGIGHQQAARVGGTARSEWKGVLAWAVAQANVADLDEVRCRIAEKVPDQLADPDGGDGYRRNALEDAHLSQRIADDWLAGRYCWAAGLGWMKWDRRRWKHISDAAITEVVRKAHRKYAADEVARGADVARIKALAGLLHASKIRAVVSLARGIVEVESDHFDQHPDLLNVGNGIIDLATGKLGLHDPALYLTKITAVDYRPEAHHDDWARALTALPADVAPWMQLRFGQAATGHMAPDDVMPVLRGSGANGKSTIVKAIHAALGDHAVVIPDRVLLANPGDHPTEMMTLRGARLALLEELPEGRHLNVKRLKDTVGTSPITARAIAKDNITWAATHTLMLTTNYLPLVDEVDHGTWRRLALVEFPFTFSDVAAPDSATDRSKVEGLRERLADGAGGRREAVLAWVVAGARRWYVLEKVMPPKPAKVATDTEKWRADTDRIYAYFTDRLIPDKASYVTAVDLYSDFVRWHEGHGNKQWSDQTFSARFENHSEIRAAGVERGRVVVAQTLGLSRPSEVPFLPDVPRRATTWHGVRFRGKTDDEAKPAAETDDALTSQNAAVSEVSGVLHPPSGGNKFSNRPTTPDTPDTGPFPSAESPTRPDESPSWEQLLDDWTEAPPHCPDCHHETAGPPGKRCNTPDLHPNGVLL